ncbi:PEP-CTERM system histidine kinase PrsK [Sphingomonas sp. RHCKR7]|uniref:XrtA/PEP-CTERM system histidine kinase PrsK n=1 Tax=Sphingomonas folli TaxID=2862497 RepID=UPI001CA5DE98|nr:XrtA/PEP-CTERM system histidine kinase PrsK [Sphingomonas folli]MBW6527258.1 PEP-CTERM system histidine kinase PrsK [Sphingomonas folli]
MTASGAATWLYALVALLYCGVALLRARDPALRRARVPLAAACALTALWALATAGIDPRDVATRVAGSARDLAWLALLAVVTDAARDPAARARLSAYAATAACLLLAAALAVASAAAPRGAVAALLDGYWLVLRLLAAAAALVLLQRAAGRDGGTAGARAPVLAALALLWGGDLIVFALAWLADGWSAALTLARGALAVAAVPPLALALHRAPHAPLRASRTLTLQAALAAGAGLYVVATGLAAGYLGALAGGYARVVQTALVFGTAAALLTALGTPWLRAWARVLVAKHLFQHRYDYRTAWLRFAETLGRAGTDADGAPLAERVVTAVAGLTDSPAALLLVADGDSLAPGAAWRCDPAPAAAGSPALARHLERSGRIVALGVRGDGATAAEAALVPDWLRLRADAWALVPLLHGERLVGAIVLASPPGARALDWEDLDLLGVAGRQAASYLAEAAAHEALADARRFDEFNRRFAFILHDLKNLVSQLALVARNAERHADNPEFRADMVATLRESSRRMTALLTRLTQAQPTNAAAAPPRAVDVRALAERLADSRRAQHPVAVSGSGAHALVDPAALETVLVHLLQNAVEASAAGVPVTLAVRDRAGAEVAVDVIDRGTGMSAAFVRERLFRPFASSKPAGFGLGAYEARQLVERMGGRIDVESRPGEGSRFRVLLPRAARVAVAVEVAA